MRRAAGKSTAGHGRSAGPALYVSLVLLFMYLPILVVVLFSLNASRYPNWTGFSLEWYEKLFRDGAMMATLGNSLKVAMWSCGLSAIIGTVGAVGMARSRFRGQGLWENMTLMPIMIPEIILGMAYLAFFTFLRVPFGMVTMVIAHTTFCIPYIFVNVQSRLVGIDPSIAEAALDLGATPTRAFFDITLPLISPAILSGLLLSFAMSMDDVVISFFVTGTTSNTLPLKVFSMLKTGVTPVVNALCTLMLAVVFLAVAFAGLARQIGARRGRTAQK